jgi:hypothetical protein
LALDDAIKKQEVNMGLLDNIRELDSGSRFAQARPMAPAKPVNNSLAGLPFNNPQAPQGMSSNDKSALALSLANSFAGMSGNPNTNSIMAGIASQQAGLQKRREKDSAQETLAKQTAMAIKMLGDKFPMLTQALQAGIISPNDAITAARKGADVKVVGKSLVDSLGNVLFTSEDAGSDSTTAFDTLKLRAKDAGLEEGTAAYQQFMIEGGAKKGMAFTSDGKGGFTLTQGGATVGKPKTEGQANATGFWDRVSIANKNLEGLEDQGTSFAGNVLASLPLGTGNWLQTEEFQLYSQSQEDWINAVLRDESGAAIGPAEFESAKTQYFPQVGDKPAVIAQKRANRKTKELGLWTKSGQDTTFPTGYSPSETTVTTRKRWNPQTRKLEEV